ncbi:hypothetical protein ACIPY3_02485 [Paenarthrobacter sp. NPDC089714]|uniref:hypothetical protein n=1 Tax=Paenarthrobacter sp. NPDC089714 TaxID=3364377 RepID=UPI003829043F
MSEQAQEAGILKTGPLEITDDEVAVIVLGKPEAIGDLGFGMDAQVRARSGIGPSLVVRALKTLVADLEREFGPDGGKCGCGRNHD